LFVVVLTAWPAEGQQGKAPLPVEALSSAATFEMLSALNEKEELVPASFMLPLSRFKELDLGSCTGARLPNGLRLAAESTGKSYGLHGFNQGRGRQEARAY
jgi:hypothetical protein